MLYVIPMSAKSGSGLWHLQAFLLLMLLLMLLLEWWWVSGSISSQHSASIPCVEADFMSALPGLGRLDGSLEGSE